MGAKRKRENSAFWEIEILGMQMLTEDTLKPANSDKGESQKASISRNIYILTYFFAPLNKDLLLQAAKVHKSTHVRIHAYSFSHRVLAISAYPNH